MIITVPQKKRSRRARVMPRARLVQVNRALQGTGLRIRRRPRQATGDRILRAPAAVGRITGSGLRGPARVPNMRSVGRNMTVTHTERFASVTTTGTGFEISSYSLNPGLGAMFPWLSDVANRYEKYKFRKVQFRYLPQSAALAGTLSLAFDFDPNDEAPASMEDANTFHDYVTSSIWAQDGVSLTIDLANGDRLPQKNTRPGLPGADLDLNVYDVGRLHVMTEGAAAATIGYLEVSYVVELFVHQVSNGVGGKVSSTAGLDATHLVGSNPTPDSSAFIPVDDTSTAVWTFTQPFQGEISCYIAGTGLSADLAPVVSASGTGSVLNQLVNAGATAVLATIKIKAKTGTTMTPTITATTVTSVSWRFSRSAYDAL